MSTTATDNDWQSPEELAAELDVPIGTIYRWRVQGTGPVGHRIGRHVRYRRSDVETWLRTQRDAR
jgi:excisionase family DNA binding protein